MIRPVVFSAPKSISNLDILSHYSFENLCRGNYSLKNKIKAFMHTQTCQNVALPSVVTRKFDSFHPKSFTIAEFISNEVKRENKEFKWKKCSDSLLAFSQARKSHLSAKAWSRKIFFEPKITRSFLFVRRLQTLCCVHFNFPDDKITIRKPTTATTWQSENEKEQKKS